MNHMLHNYIHVMNPLTTFFQKKTRFSESSSQASNNNPLQASNERQPPQLSPPSQAPTASQPSATSDQACSSWKFNENELVVDPGLRSPISELGRTEKEREVIRRAYLNLGPIQPDIDYLWSEISLRKRRFQYCWFDMGKEWMEYSVAKDAVFCLYCYLFKVDHGGQGGSDVFVHTGFRSWGDKQRVKTHAGKHNSFHRICEAKCLALKDQSQHIDQHFLRAQKQNLEDYFIRLKASITCVRYCLQQGLPFRGHDETELSDNKGNFLELLKVLGDTNPVIGAVLSKNPDNHTMASHHIQKDIANACAILTTNVIIDEIVRDNQPFSILVDESRDVSIKEQMAIVLRFVNNEGYIMERFVGVVHVRSTTALCLKAAIDSFFLEHRLSVSNLRGQGYDGASNMRGQFNGLKSLFLKENSSSYYIHCFAHQLQLALVGLVKHHADLGRFFDCLSVISNVISVSCLRMDLLREVQRENIIKEIEAGERETGSGLNQESSVRRPGDTRWGSYGETIFSVIKLLPSILHVLHVIETDSSDAEKKTNASKVLVLIDNFDFVFMLLFMRDFLAITNELSKSLQRKDQDLVNAMQLVILSKSRLNILRNDDEKFERLWEEACNMCDKYGIEAPDSVDGIYWKSRKYARRGREIVTNKHHFKYVLMNTALDQILGELDSRFDEVNMRLLQCMASLDPSDNFRAFDKEKLIELAGFYPRDFDEYQLWELNGQLENYYGNLTSLPMFSKVKGISELARLMVETKKDRAFEMVFKLIKLVLVLPVATASVERVFSAMNLVKTSLRNRIGDQWFNDCLVVYVERNIFLGIEIDAIINQFQKMKKRKLLLTV